jgi:hypothetical protein
LHKYSRLHKNYKICTKITSGCDLAPKTSFVRQGTLCARAQTVVGVGR